MMARARFLVFTLLALAWLPAPARAQDFYASDPVLRAGDRIRLQVWRQPEFSGEFRVTADGTIAHPLLQSIVVRDRHIDQVEREISTFLREYLEVPALIVEGLVLVPVGGEVRSPDVYWFPLNTSIARAVALAGGPTQRGDLYKVILRRDGQPYTLDLNDPNLRFRDLEVRSGDEIVVERRVSIMRDYVIPYASLTGAVATIIRLFR